MKYIIANWKSHKSLGEAKKWMERLVLEYVPKSNEVVVVAVPFPYVFELHKILEERRVGQISLATQDISPFPLGAYTGAVAAEMVKQAVEVVLVGHSERREYFHETHQEVANKISQAKEVGLRPVVCVDEPYAQRQLAAIEEANWHNLVVAYEPLEAIGSGKPQPVKEVEAVVKKIKKMATKIPILYGGSVTAENASDYMAVEGIEGLLVGGASLSVDSFMNILRRI